MMTVEKIKVLEPTHGFTERDKNSKAILNTDADALLKYKIHRKKILDINKNNEELNTMREEIGALKNDIGEIKSMLLAIIQSR